MNILFKFIILFCSFLILTSCSGLKNANFDTIKTANPNADLTSKILLQRLKEIPYKGIAFGHQDATMYGINWDQSDTPNILQSDIAMVSGKMPAVHGYDLGHIELGLEYNLDTVAFNVMRKHIQKLHDDGAIITFSWHLDNPKSLGSSWDTTATVKEILKAGEYRKRYEGWVTNLSNFFKSLKSKKGNFIPVIFRPFHEMNGSWFWWGKGNCSPEDYKSLWQETFQLLQENEVNNLLFAYAPNTLSSPEEFDTYYPGDQYVDILGVDIYNYGDKDTFIANIQNNLLILKEKAARQNKPFALTETGNTKSGSDETWWTETLYPGIKDSGISWVLLWRNARLDHYFSVYPDDISAEDFKEFAGYKETLFLNKVKNINSKKTY